MFITTNRVLFTKSIIAILLVCMLTPNQSYGLGSLAHNYVAKQVAQQIKETNPKLYQIIEDHWNDYLVGSDYPDTGYIPGATYGEISHWQPFVDAFIKHLHDAYPEPSVKRDRLLAFLMGICTHIQSDITVHWTYYNLVAKYDFDNLPDPETAWNTAHEYMDPATDFYVIVRKHIYNHPTIWCIPVDDLVNVYKIMNHDVTAEEIIHANAIYYIVTGIDETLIALPGYWYDKHVAVPWGIEHLETSDTNELRYGAFPGQIYDSSTYLEAVWIQYTINPPTVDFSKQQQRPGRSSRPWLSPTMQLVSDALSNKSIQVHQSLDSEGYVTLRQDPNQTEVLQAA